MLKFRFYGSISGLIFGAMGITGGAWADVPSVAVDIPPVHSLVAMVMGDLGTPDLIVQPGASPHGYSLRPSQAAALQNADLIYWVSAGLTPWIEGPIDALAKDAQSVELLETERTTEWEFREGATFEHHGHEEETDDNAHTDHAHDPHAWLDPENARVWLNLIAANLAGLDPENADIYAANAVVARSNLADVIGEINTDLTNFRGVNFVVFHDSYQYFENRFNVPSAGAITIGDASDPSPARIAEIRDMVADLGVSCAFTEPQFNPGLVQAIFQKTDVVIGVLDPLGSNLTLGPQLYPQLLHDLADNLVSCLK